MTTDKILIKSIEKKKLIECLLSKSTMYTFIAIQKDDTTTENIIKKYGLGKTACYRSIKKLESIGLCYIKKIIFDEKTLKKTRLWTTPFKSLSITMNYGILEIVE